MEKQPNPIMKFFKCDHLPQHLQGVSGTVFALASSMDAQLPDCAEKSAGLRKLLEARDCFVRGARKREVMLTVEQIARVCHEVNRAYCEALGDTSQKPWDDAPQWQRESAIKGVEFHVRYPSASASASHDSWWDQKKADGWVFGLVKDETTKTHPCCVPFGSLPVEQQAKDYLFRSIVHQLSRL